MGKLGIVNWYPGIDRHKSFATLFTKERLSILQLVNKDMFSKERDCSSLIAKVKTNKFDLGVDEGPISITFTERPGSPR
jgi:hypothetical protein